MKHVAEVLQLLKILTGSKKYDINQNLMYKKGESVTMDSWLDNTIEKAENKGKIEALFELIKDGILTIKEAAKRMGMTVAKFKKELTKLNLDYNLVS